MVQSPRCSAPTRGCAGTLVIALVNNMPDAALEATERQFAELLRAAAGEAEIDLRLFSLPKLPRDAAARAHLSRTYTPIDELWAGSVDGLIVTGTEPRAPLLTDEHFWASLAKLVDWAEDHTRSAIWSCLAAHAAVLHIDGIHRQTFPEKLFGVFECTRTSGHRLVAGLPSRWLVPHSRHNGLAEPALVACGYHILSHSPQAGADMFVKNRGSLFLFFQGHPEYGPGTLLREYRRDVGRFLTGSRDNYPAMPHGLDDATAAAFETLRQHAMHDRNSDLLACWPVVADQPAASPWQPCAVRLYKNWLQNLTEEKSRAQSSGSRCVRASKIPAAAQPSAARQPDREPSALFPSREFREHVEDFLTREIADADRRIANGAIAPTFDRAAFRTQLAGFDFRRPAPLEGVLKWAIGQIEHGVVHMTHPRYFGLFNPAPTFPSQCADRIVAAFNPQLATSTTSPAATEIEAHVIRGVAERAGFPPTATGHFTTGGAEANYTALICALTRSEPRFAAEGARAYPGPPAFYVSRDAHLAWLKIAHQAGIGRTAVRLVATDGFGRLDPNALAAVVRADRVAGRAPVMIAATAGTTNAGMIDPLPECGEIARAEGLWYHVDAAWGGAVIASERLRGLLAGIGQADSMTIDAHKWFATTMGCGMFLTRHAPTLASAFQVSTGYMPSNVYGLDPYVTSVQWSRRFLGLRLFLSLAAAGWSGYGRHVERSTELVKLLERMLSARGWRIANNSSLGVLCVVPPADFPAARVVVDQIVASGRAWISAATFEGRDVIRACVTHGQTTVEDIAGLVEALQAARQRPAAVTAQ